MSWQMPQREAEANRGKILLVEQTLAQERGLSFHNLQLQAEKWEEHASTITMQAEEAIADVNEEKGEALEKIDQLPQRLIHYTTEVEECDRWYANPGDNEWGRRRRTPTRAACANNTCCLLYPLTLLASYYCGSLRDKSTNNFINSSGP